MKKTLFISTIIIVLISVIAPKFVSNSFNQKLDSIVELINKNPVYSASIKDRTSAWFTSTATINIAIDSGAFSQIGAPDTSDVLTDMNVDIEIDAQHGPILTQNGLALGWLAWNATVDGNTLRDTLMFEANTPFYQVTAQTNLFGSSSLSDTIPSFTMKDDEVFTQFSFSGWNGSGSFSDSAANYQGMLGKITADSAFGKFELNQWSVDSNMQGNLMNAMNGSFYDSTMSMQIQDITFEQASNQAQTALTEFKMDAISDFDKTSSLLDLQLNLALQELTTAELNLSSARVNIEINNLQEQFFKAYQNVMSELSQEPEKAQENLKRFIQTELLGQLQAEPEYNISSFKVTLNEGNIAGSMNNKIHQVTTLPDTLESPAFWLQHLMSDAQIDADKSAALWLAANTIKAQIKADPSSAQMSENEINNIAEQQAAAMLQGVQQQGILTETATGYQLQFSLKDGQALLNGNPMPLPGL